MELRLRLPACSGAPLSARKTYLTSLSCRATVRISLAPLLSSKSARSMPSFSASSWTLPGILLAVTPTRWTCSSTFSELCGRNARYYENRFLCATKVTWQKHNARSSYLGPHSDADLHGFLQAVWAIQTVYRPRQVQLQKHTGFLRVTHTFKQQAFKIRWERAAAAESNRYQYRTWFVSIFMRLLMI